jgi:cellulose synthase/poly-beta-1,6-N-acetylglucosamine synthase-like glycosyltransferase
MISTAAVVCFIFAVVFLMLAAHPFITYPLSLRFFRKAPPTATVSSTPLSFTICMCAYNEAAIIEQKVHNLLELKRRRPELQILIYVDAASDHTAQLLQPFAADIECHVNPTRRGKTFGMNLLVSRARGDVLVFTDANVMLASDCLDALERDFSDASIGCVCGQLTYMNSDQSITAATGSLYWRLEESVKRLEQRSGSVMGADGSLFAIRRSLHRTPPDHIIDDMYVSFMVLMQGFRIVQSTTAQCYEASASSGREEFSRKARIACQAFNVHRLLWPRLRQLDALTIYKYLSHKVLRWLCIYSLAIATVFLLAGLLISGEAVLALSLLACAIAATLLGLKSIKPFAQLIDMLVSMAGAGLGVWKSLRGERFQTWTPAASVRRVELR